MKGRLLKPQIKKMLSKRKLLERELDRLWARRVKECGKCEHCSMTGNLHAAHIISRRHKNTRWDIRNGICLCRRCHLFFAHREPLEFAEFVKSKLDEKEYTSLMMRGRMSGKDLDLELIKLSLKME